MPLLLTESLDPARRENAHLHIEQCALCSDEWSGYKETWQLLGEVPEVEPPARIKQRFLAAIDPKAAEIPNNVVPFHRRPALKWLAQAAAVVVIAGGAYFTGHRTLPAQETKPLRSIENAEVTPLFSIAESRVIPASAINPTIEGRPDIQNVSFSNVNPTHDEIGVSFDITSHVTVTGHPNDASMVRLMRYVLENEERMSPSGSAAIDWVRNTYAQPGNANAEIAKALGNVLRNDTREGVRIKAAETLTKLPAAMAPQDTREALIEALKSDPNPAVRIKAVEALANLVRSGAQLDASTIDTLRQKASQDGENVYVRVKAAEALSNMRP